MLEYILFATGIILGIGTYHVIKKPKRNQDIFTITSDKAFKANKFDDIITSNKNHPDTEKSNLNIDMECEESEKNSKSKNKKIDMSMIQKIILDGSAGATFTSDQLILDKNAALKLGNHHTLYIYSKNNGSKNKHNLEYLNSYDLENFNSLHIEYIIVKGSGNLVFDQLSFKHELDIHVKGSGDINLLGCTCYNAYLAVHGSGDIMMDRDCEANRLNLTVIGSGDIRIKTKKYKQLIETIIGSGDIHIM